MLWPAAGDSPKDGSHENLASLTLAPALDLSSYTEINFPYPFSGEAAGSQEHPFLWKNRIPRRDHYLHRSPLRMQGFGEGSEPALAQSQTKDMGTTALPRW